MGMTWIGKYNPVIKTRFGLRYNALIRNCNTPIFDINISIPDSKTYLPGYVDQNPNK